MSEYYPGHTISISRSPTTITGTTTAGGVSPVTYEVGGVSKSGVQISPTQIQPDGYPAEPIVIIGSAAGQASNVEAVGYSSGAFVEKAGDEMTGDLDMSGNQIDNVNIKEGTF